MDFYVLKLEAKQLSRASVQQMNSWRRDTTFPGISISYFFRTTWTGACASASDLILMSLILVPGSNRLANSDYTSSFLPMVGLDLIWRALGVKLVPATARRSFSASRSASINSLLVADLTSRASFRTFFSSCVTKVDYTFKSSIFHTSVPGLYFGRPLWDSAKPQHKR